MIINRSQWSTYTREHGPEFAAVAHLPGLVAQPTELLSLIQESLANATDPELQAASGLPRIRVFERDSLSYAASESVTHTRYDGTDLVSWLQSAAGRLDVCAAFNSVETWSARTRSEIYREIVAPMVEASGVPPRGLDVYSFIAASGFTPFGVHSDPEPSFIFHLGPQTKTVWVWEQSTLAALDGGRDVSLNIDEYLSTADHTVVLEPGDFLCIPGQLFHVFRNDGPAVFLGMSYYLEDNEEELLQAVSAAVRREKDVRPYDALEAAAADGRIGQELNRRTELRAQRGHLGAHRLFPADAYSAEHPAEITTTPVEITPDRLSAMGRSVALPDGVRIDALRTLMKSTDQIGPSSFDGIVDDTRAARALYLALLRIGALVQVSGDAL